MEADAAVQEMEEDNIVPLLSGFTGNRFVRIHQTDAAHQLLVCMENDL